MWKIERIECENFISFQKAELNIPQNVCTLIYGLNNDNMQQRNNGTGKSSIIEAIAFALTGEPLRSVDKVEEIINDNAETANVYMELSNDYDNTIFTIERTVNRKTPQTIECHKYDEHDNEIEQNRTSQPTVLDYNRYILEEIGLSKDDIYSNFILSNSKYKSFFDASDKVKKAMINRFSGADKIDEVIEILHQDRVPVEEVLGKAKDHKIAIEAKLEVVDGQLADADNKKAEWAAAKEERIANINTQIALKREELRTEKKAIAKANTRLDAIDSVGSYIEDELQSSDTSLADVYKKIVDKFNEYKLDAIKDYVAINESSEKAISKIAAQQKELKTELNDLQKKVDESEKLLKDAQKQANELQSETDKQNAESIKALEKIKSKLSEIKAQIETTQQNCRTASTQLNNSDVTIEQLTAKIKGAIVCPKCKHRFFLSEEMTLEQAEKKLVDEKKNNKEWVAKKEQYNKELKDAQQQQVTLEKEKTEIDDNMSKRADKLSEMSRSVREYNNTAERFASQILEVQRKLTLLTNDIQAEEAKVEGLMKKMFSEALDIIDNTIEKGENYVTTCNDKCTSINASIESFEKTIEEVKNSSQDDFVASLNDSKGKYEKELQTAITELEVAQAEYDKYVVQENYFVDFRSYLANKKVKAISGVTNHFLELINSDLRVEMLGFKKLKNGKIRDKITVNILRNGVDCGSYAKFSGGERARVNLASILGLQRLTNNSTPKGKGLDLLVLDEILSESDAEGINAMSDALNKLKITSLLVVQDTVCNDYGNVIIVEKYGGYSHVSWK